MVYTDPMYEEEAKALKVVICLVCVVLGSTGVLCQHNRMSGWAIIGANVQVGNKGRLLQARGVAAS